MDFDYSHQGVHLRIPTRFIVSSKVSAFIPGFTLVEPP